MRYITQKRYRVPLAPPRALWQNSLNVSRYLYFALAIAAGMGLSLLIGFLANPVQLPDASIRGLREDYKADYVLMVAESYSFDGDLDLAMARLNLLGDENAIQSVQKALIFAVDQGYSTIDLVVMRDLEVAVRNWSPPDESLP